MGYDFFHNSFDRAFCGGNDDDWLGAVAFRRVLQEVVDVAYVVQGGGGSCCVRVAWFDEVDMRCKNVGVLVVHDGFGEFKCFELLVCEVVSGSNGLGMLW